MHSVSFFLRFSLNETIAVLLEMKQVAAGEQFPFPVTTEYKKNWTTKQTVLNSRNRSSERKKSAIKDKIWRKKRVQFKYQTDF